MTRLRTWLAAAAFSLVAALAYADGACAQALEKWTHPVGRYSLDFTGLDWVEMPHEYHDERFTPVAAFAPRHMQEDDLMPLCFIQERAIAARPGVDQATSNAMLAGYSEANSQRVVGETATIERFENSIRDGVRVVRWTARMPFGGVRYQVFMLVADGVVLYTEMTCDIGSWASEADHAASEAVFNSLAFPGPP